MEITKRNFGKTKKGQEVSLYSLKNSKGMEIVVTDYGATLVSVFLTDSTGSRKDVVLGYDSVEGYQQFGGYLGATIGRNGNRIGKAQAVIDGRIYPLDDNENGNNLHSGFGGFDKVIWKTEPKEKENAVTFSHISPSMDQGFPGEFKICVTYTLTEENELTLHYEGVSSEDTIANMTNHSYFNLAGHDMGDICGHLMQIDAERFTVIDGQSIPTGELRLVEGTPMDFRKPTAIGQGIDADYEQLKLACGYDHNYVLNNQKGIRKVACVREPESGCSMEVYTDCVGVQFYTGNFIEDTQIGKGGWAYHARSGFCMETQYYPDAVHHEAFPSPVLRAGEKYDSTTIYKFRM